MILRRITKHIKDQNWFAVGVDIFVVILGVYLGIYIGGIADENLENKRAQQTAAFLQVDLIADLDSLEKVLSAQQNVFTAFTRAAELLAEEERDEAALQQAMSTILTMETPTYFPDSSNYKALLSQGGLNLLQSSSLRRSISRLYEHTYPRHHNYAQLYDQQTDYVFREQISRYWDRIKHQLLTDNPDDIALFRNQLSGQARYTEGYITFLKQDVQGPANNLRALMGQSSYETSRKIE